MEISGNIAESAGQSPEGKLRSTKQAQAPATPTRHKRSKNVATVVEPPEPLESLEEEEDMEQTPRPNITDKIPPLYPRPPNPQDRGESSESSESHESKQARSRSPTKRLVDLQFSEMPVDRRAWSASTIPAELKELVTDMHKIGRSIAVIPLAVKDKLVAVEEDVEEFQWLHEGGKHRGKGEGKSGTDTITGGLGHSRFWDRVVEVHKNTVECLNRGFPEPAWNEKVHSKILDLALTGYWETKEVWYMNVTVARISNKSLVPWNIATGAMQSKMVDYAIIIDPSQDFSGDPSSSLHNHIIEKLRTEKRGASINQTAADWICFQPIAINIETKKGAVNEDESHLQLGTWLIAQFSRLRQLIPDQAKAKTKLPSFPILSVQGQRWLLMIASLRENDRINLIKELHLGDTGSIAGVYQVVAAIRRLAQWVNDDYRPWFEREILGIKAGISSRP